MRSAGLNALLRLAPAMALPVTSVARSSHWLQHRLGMLSACQHDQVLLCD